MSYEDFDHYGVGVEALTTTFAIFIGALWTYQRFVRTREDYPKIEFNVDLVFVHKQAGFWAVEVQAIIENKGLVRHLINDFTFDLRCLFDTDSMEEKAPFLLHLPHRVSEGSWLPSTWEDTFVEPGIREKYVSIARIPEHATMVLIHGKFYYSKTDWHTADRLVRVPRPIC